MELERATLGPEAAGRPWLRLAFPGGPAAEGGAEEPSAWLSLKAAGNLRWLGANANPARERFLRSLGVAPGRAVGADLRHSRRVAVLEGIGPAEGKDGEAGGYEADCLELLGLEPGDPGSDPRREGDGGPDGAPGVDGMLSFEPRLVPCVTVADCMPIWLLDRASGAFGVLHSGWKGTGILAAAVTALLRRRGGDASAVSVILGPAIGPCCYGVDEARARRFEAEFGPGSVREGEGGPRLDLRAANLALARKLGIGFVLSVDACTSCDARLGSYRREGPADFTRMLALAGRLEGPALR